MATSNHARWVGNLNGATEPMIYLGLFQAGSTAAVAAGEMIEFTGNGNAAWVAMDADFAGAGNVAVANEDVKAGDLAGYYEIIVPRPGDLFEFDIDTAAATAYGTTLYYSSSTELSASGTNELAYAVGQEHYPLKQFHLSDGQIGDNGSTIKSQGTVIVTFELASSLWAKLSVTA